MCINQNNSKEISKCEFKTNLKNHSKCLTKILKNIPSVEQTFKNIPSVYQTFKKYSKCLTEKLKSIPIVQTEKSKQSKCSLAKINYFLITISIVIPRKTNKCHNTKNQTKCH